MKSIIMLALLTWFSYQGHAATSSQEVPYYGEAFYRELASGVTNDDLKDSLKKVLLSYHQKQDGDLDQIVKGCNGEKCYGHVSLGYDRARIFMMGVYYLTKTNKGYAIYDVYCDTNKTTEDFIHGNGPGPKNIPDGEILNTEHTWPQSRFSRRFDKNMQKSDLHHLYPTDSDMNSVRGNNPFGEVAKDSRVLECPASRTGKSTSGSEEVFEPPKNHKGNVARALFYFSVRYEMPLGKNQEAFLRKWHKEDPVNEEEIRRNDFIQSVQGNRNPFIDHPELVDRIDKF
ncbi:putative secreted nuclease [Bdellovibrio bacteriovorus W]|nr:putative secreted nuclease [Bdellovibrio bacteriovorus W]